ncbi:hypothetical protein JTE90_002301 [Oedothorax gibbosus]|uniref:Uncharacterized protein n=1 Tax=Oedothorax gibbosus TaxID=931172 RepID=A0AAV6UJM2_9ARAC|nr:hypothetical protein JTE90_002301 [Oedothorax gibbosus]
MISVENIASELCNFKQQSCDRFTSLEEMIIQSKPGINKVVDADVNVPSANLVDNIDKNGFTTSSGKTFADVVSLSDPKTLPLNQVNKRGQQSTPKPVISGTSKISKLMPATRFPRRAAAFVSRLNPSTQAIEVQDFLSSLKLSHLKCVKMKTKFNSYSSFHIEILESDLQVLLDDGLWPEGCIIFKFFGRLKQDQILMDPNVNDIRNSSSSMIGDGHRDD